MLDTPLNLYPLLAVPEDAHALSLLGIVPYVNPPVTGSIAGIVGAGGNTGKSPSPSTDIGPSAN